MEKKRNSKRKGVLIILLIASYLFSALSSFAWIPLIVGLWYARHVSARVLMGILSCLMIILLASYAVGVQTATQNSAEMVFMFLCALVVRGLYEYGSEKNDT